MPRAATTIPLEKFFTRTTPPAQLVRELKAQEKAAGRDPKLLQVAVGKTRVPLSKIEKDLGAMWKDRFDPGPLGKGESFRPKLEANFYDPSSKQLSKTSLDRLGKLSDAAVREITFSDTKWFAKLDSARTEPAFINFLARSVELDTANAPWAAAALKTLFQQPLSLPDRKVALHDERGVAAAWMRAAQALDLDPRSINVVISGTKAIPLAVVGPALAKQAHEDEVFNSRRYKFVHDPILGVGEGGAMPFDYSSAPGYGGGTGLMPGYDNVPRAVGQRDVPAREPLRLKDPPADIHLAPGTAPTPAVSPRPELRVKPAPGASSGGIEFTPPPPQPPPAIGRPLISTPWEIIATPGAMTFFEAKARGYDGSWEDWKAR